MTNQPCITFTKPSITDLEIRYATDVQVNEWSQGYGRLPIQFAKQSFRRDMLG